MSSLPTLLDNFEPFIVIPCLKLAEQTHRPCLRGAWVRTPQIIFRFLDDNSIPVLGFAFEISHFFGPLFCLSAIDVMIPKRNSISEDHNQKQGQVI